MVTREYFDVMGVPLSGPPSRVAGILAAESTNPLSDDVARVFCGNGMHVPSVGAVCVFALASVGLRAVGSQQPSHLADDL